MTTALEGGEWSAARSSRTLPPGKTGYLFYRRLCGTQGRSGQGGISRLYRDSTPDCPASNQSLYRLSYPFHITEVKVKVKRCRYRPGVAQRMGRGIALLFHDRGTRRGWVVSSTPRPILQEVGWAPRADLDGRKISYLPGFYHVPKNKQYEYDRIRETNNTT